MTPTKVKEVRVDFVEYVHDPELASLEPEVTAAVRRVWPSYTSTVHLERTRDGEIHCRLDGSVGDPRNPVARVLWEKIMTAVRDILDEHDHALH